MIVVTVPAYNESKNLRKCLESLLKVTPLLGDDFRIVIAEDGSTDGTDLIAQELEHRYTPVIHIHSPLHPLSINVLSQLGHIILQSPRFLTVSSFSLLEKGKRQPHVLHLM